MTDDATSTTNSPIVFDGWRSISIAVFMALVDSFYRSGSLVFGGGHVVLPLLQSEVVPTGWVSQDAFLPATALHRPCRGRYSPSSPTETIPLSTESSRTVPINA
jgi:hypothetical protein